MFLDTTRLSWRKTFLVTSDAGVTRKKGTLEKRTNKTNTNTNYGDTRLTIEKNQDRIRLRRKEIQKIGTVTPSVGFSNKKIQNGFIDYKLLILKTCMNENVKS